MEEHYNEELDRSSLYRYKANLQINSLIPAEYQQSHFTRRSMPSDLLASIVEAAPAYREKEKSVAISLRDLPVNIQRELQLFLYRSVSLGRNIVAQDFNHATRGLEIALEQSVRDGMAPPGSILSLPIAAWIRLIRKARMAGTQIAVSSERLTARWLHHVVDHLAIYYHEGPWWKLDVWHPILDSRIPLRKHEPLGRHLANFAQLTTQWLREAAKWWLKTELETGQYTYSSVQSRLGYLRRLQRFLDTFPVDGPDLAGPRGNVRDVAAAFAHWLRTTPTNRDGDLSPNAIRTSMVTVEAFYRFMWQYREAAARELDPRWANLGVEHSVFFAPTQKPRHTNQPQGDWVLEDEVVHRIAQGAALIALPVDEGGMGDEQAFRALMLQMATGRRVNEILMLEFDPLQPLSVPVAEDGEWFVARLRYTLTKLDGQDPTIPIDADAVAAIRTQQQWVRERLGPDMQPKYLFVRKRTNRLGRHPYPEATYHALMNRLGRALDLRNSAGTPIRLGRTHQFRHTQATKLLNLGVPLHVVQRYLGHASPTMTMIYAQTLSKTLEAEFTRFKKLTADGKELNADPRELFDTAQLDRRTDRILPNGLCLLPPRQVCTKGNACLSCSQFVTDAGHERDLRSQLEQTEALVASRQKVFEDKFGAPMPADNVWLAGRLQEIGALRNLLQVIGTDGGKRLPVIGAGIR
ncbi:MAG TPA: tyrosine-type recombinase/integrase [Candidatus Dormibacteraeota bacterium]|nr:tyrosine-type recombinase/integrase [Candidatus Dormibacteraeota bacterium]